MTTTTTTAMTACTFKGCANERLSFTDKCAFHKSRSKCSVQDCPNMVYARNRCVRHGGKKTCQFPGCGANVRGGDFCTRHGGHIVKRYCTAEGCTKQAHAQQKCVSHGGGRYCRVAGCKQHIRVGGYCNQHRQSTSPLAPVSSDEGETTEGALWESVLHTLYIKDASLSDTFEEDDLTWLSELSIAF